VEVRIFFQANCHFLTWHFSNQNETGNLFFYFTQGVCATEVEVDTLTGDHTVLRVDINMDVGKVAAHVLPFYETMFDVEHL
jgi:xanthine dehydrogenase molybdopterin-binding subunit B